MKFLCKKCKKTKNLHKVKLAFHFGKAELVCKDAFCCDDFMVTVDTEENAGMPTIVRNEPKHSKPSGDKLWKDAKDNLLSGEGMDKYKHE